MTNLDTKIHETIGNRDTFTLFPKLSPQLRRYVWIQALPSDLKTAPAFLFPYKKGCWHHERVIEFDDNDNHDHRRRTVRRYEFRTELLDTAQFKTSIALVNRESREVAQTWVRQQRVPQAVAWDTTSSAIFHAFDPNHDALFVPLIQWDELLDELYQGFVNTLRGWGHLAHSANSKVKYLAVTDDLLLCEFDNVRWLRDILRPFPKVEALLVVAGPIDYSGEAKPPRYYEFSQTPELCKYKWNNGRWGLDCGGGHFLDGEIQDGSIKPLLEHIKNAFDLHPRVDPFIEVWSVVAENIL
uniref:2EXR domain-containing protein n=1 Tax=Bionectria ochroleuca TaxID=29856 RepID=A0A8H7N892_BIOOC